MASGTINRLITYKDFVIEHHILASGATTINANDIYEFSGNITKTGGWYPLAISGFSYVGSDSRYAYFYTNRISQQAIGSASTIVRIKNTKNAAIALTDISIYVLWIRA